jgi:hypothetical protein
LLSKSGAKKQFSMKNESSRVVKQFPEQLLRMDIFFKTNRQHFLFLCP